MKTINVILVFSLMCVFTKQAELPRYNEARDISNNVKEPTPTKLQRYVDPGDKVKMNRLHCMEACRKKKDACFAEQPSRESSRYIITGWKYVSKLMRCKLDINSCFEECYSML